MDDEFLTTRRSKGAWIRRFTDDGATFVHWPLTGEDRTPADLIEEAALLGAHREENVTGQRTIPAGELRTIFERRKQAEAGHR